MERKKDGKNDEGRREGRQMERKKDGKDDEGRREGRQMKRKEEQAKRKKGRTKKGRTNKRKNEQRKNITNKKEEKKTSFHIDSSAFMARKNEKRKNQKKEERKRTNRKKRKGDVFFSFLRFNLFFFPSSVLSFFFDLPFFLSLPVERHLLSALPITPKRRCLSTGREMKKGRTKQNERTEEGKKKR
jgi:hypothetical protein